ncbi:hypothetical protein LTR36_010868 [Oleoguttula mirabilis]|uniref:Uncharacterized protein n=1 Tax=Oleoguttula mirabilis TaxID=1507867 RepID=A0AAV9J4H6_9PEZI|nr:hypothetical protein LTR36_010868 [Oleoguttula mirabilis]
MSASIVSSTNQTRQYTAADVAGAAAGAGVLLLLASAGVFFGIFYQHKSSDRPPKPNVKPTLLRRTAAEPHISPRRPRIRRICRWGVEDPGMTLNPHPKAVVSRTILVKRVVAAEVLVTL